MQLMDSTDRYGTVSRTLHWGMAVLLLWQFFIAFTRMVAEDSTLDNLLWGAHKPTGFLLLVLAGLRLVWALSNLAHRPPSVNRLARLGHILLYGVMLLVPSLGLLRQYGSGKAFEPFGLSLMAGQEGDEISWMVDLGNLLHGELGLIFLLLIIGHIAMAGIHRRRSGDVDVLSRMIG